MSDKPYWFPVLCDESYFARLREDYPGTAHLSDEALLDHYNKGLEYQILWDHIGDAYSDYRPMADSYLGLLKALTALVDINDNDGPFGGELRQDRIDRAWDFARSEILKATKP